MIIKAFGNLVDGDRTIIDDYREAYYWLNQNTDEDAKVMAWWDYGYQLAGMSNRTTIVDNNTWNFTHIGTVAKVMITNEEEAHEMLTDMGIEYIMVSFGGYSGIQMDEHVKVLWFIRIAHDTYPEVNEWDYYNNKKYGIEPGELSDTYA